MLYFLQSKLIYYPTREIEVTPAAAGLAYEQVALRAADAVLLGAWFVPAEDARGTVLFCHGNAGNISHRLDSIRIFHDLGLSVLIFDYRGYGTSEGKPSEQGTYLDAEAAWAYLTEARRVGPSRIIVFGRSLGGAVAARLAADKAPAGLIVESAFTSIPGLGRELYWFLPVRWICRFRYATAEYVRKINCPILVVHGREDEIIPFRHGERIFEAARRPKRFLAISGGHNDGFLVSRDVYQAGLEQFLRDVVGAGNSEDR